MPISRRNTRPPEQKTILSAVAANGAGTSFNVTPYRHILIAVVGGGSTNLTVKCQGSVRATEPTWASAQSTTNIWDYVGMHDYQDASLVPGDTGVAFSGSADVRQFIVNTDGLQWLNFIVSAFSAGTVSVYAVGLSNQ